MKFRDSWKIEIMSLIWMFAVGYFTANIDKLWLSIGIPFVGALVFSGMISWLKETTLREYFESLKEKKK